MIARIVALVLTVAVAGCSALFNPDPARLGGGVDGDVVFDAPDAIDFDADGSTPHDAQDATDGQVLPDVDPSDGGPDSPTDADAAADTAPCCDDGIDCTDDSCPDGACVHTPNDELCDDGDPCTVDQCNALFWMCLQTGRDDDSDGHDAESVDGTFCGGTDCDDTSAAINPWAFEACNGIDDNCDGVIDEECFATPESCLSAIAIESGESVEGEFSAVGDDYGTLCSGTGSRDAVYYVELIERSDVRIDTIGSSADTVLAVASTCGVSGFLRACNDNTQEGETASRMWVRNVGPSIPGIPTRLYILVEGADSSVTGDYAIHVEVETFADACANTIDITGGGTVSGVIPSLAFSRAHGSCGALGGLALESVATFSPSGDGDSHFAAVSEDFVPDLYVRQGSCGDSGVEVGCAAGVSTGGPFSTGGSATLTIATDGSGPSTHYIFIDGARPNDTYAFAYEP